MSVRTYMAICPDHKMAGLDWSEYNVESAAGAARCHAKDIRDEDPSEDDWNGQVIVKDPAGNMTIFDVDIEVVVDVRDLGEYDEEAEES